jgi:hypothetical protein
MAAVEYAITYRDATDVMGTITDTPQTRLGLNETVDEALLDEPSSADGLEQWRGIANAEMESAAFQLGPIDREVVEASRGLQRREADWPIARISTGGSTTRFDPTVPDGEDDDVGEALGERVFLPPSRLSDIQGRVAARTSAALDNGDAREESIDFQSLLTTEVVRLRFRYHDGRNWRSDWDSRALGGLPRAVEIILAVLPTDQVAVDRQLERYEENPTARVSQWPVYRHVVVLPTATVRREHHGVESGAEFVPTNDNVLNDQRGPAEGVEK